MRALLVTRKDFAQCLVCLCIFLFSFPVRSQPLSGDSAPGRAQGLTAEVGTSSHEQITISFVSTAEELEESLRNGVTHVELTNHILLTTDLTITDATETIRLRLLPPFMTDTIYRVFF